MATRKSEWLASIKPILDRDEAKRDAKELAKELGDLLEINIDASPENLKQLTDEFNKRLSQMGKQPIVFSEKTLQGIIGQFANAVAEGFSKGANVGLEETFKLQLANLKKQKEVLLKEQEDINRRVSNRSRIEKINKFEIEKAHALPIDGNAVKQAEQLLDKMYEYADRISEIQAEQGKDSEAYISTVLDAQEAYNEFLRMQKSLKKIKPAMPNDLKAAYDLFRGDEEERYRAAGGRTNAFNYDQYGGEIILDAFEEISDVLINTDDQLDDIQKRLKAIDLQIESIVAQAKASGAVDDTILGNSKDGLKTLKEIEDAYDRIAKKNKKTGGKAFDNVATAVDYVPGSESLTTLRNRYNTSLSSNEDWEVQYQWLVKFVKEYENYSAQIEAETDSIKRKNMRARQKQYTSLYEELKPMAENAETMLRGIIDVSGGKQPAGVKDANKKDSVAGPTPEDVANAEKIAASERQAREDAAAKAKAEAEAAEAAKQKRIEEEKAAKAAEKKRLADEAAAEAQRKAAEEAEREQRAKEASAAAETKSYTGYRAIEPPDSSKKTKEDALLDWGAEYFSTDPKVAASYGENFFKEGSIIIGEITPKNPLVINANGLRWDEFDKMPKLKELFPDLLDLMKQPGYIGDDGQKYINDQARQAGYDSVILENVQDALDGDIKNYDLSTTIAVLDDKIVSLTGSMAQLEAGTNKFSNVVSPEIPSYYVGGQRGGEDASTEVQDVGTAFKHLIDYIKKSGQEPKQFFDALAGGAQNVDDELKQILTTLDLFDSQGNLNLKSIESGFTNLGGMVSDTYTLIARGKDYLPKSQDLIPKLADAKQMGANVGEILDVFEDEATGRLYELQKTMPGTIIPDNTDFLQATDEQILNLIADLQTLRKTGLYVDFGNDNILYDKEQGFSFIDLGTKFQEGQETVAGTAQELLKSIKPVFADNELFGDFEGRLISIASVLGVKIPQAAQNAEQAVGNLNTELKETENTVTGSESAGGAGDAPSAELEAAVTKTEALQDEVEQKNKELAVKDEEIARIQAESDAEKRALDDAKATLQNDLDDARQQLEDAEYTRDLYDSAMNQLTEESNEKDRIIYDLREQLANVKTGMGEEQASVSSEELKNVLSSIVYNVKLVHDDNDKQANKIAIDESVLESTLKRVFTNVLNPHTEQNDSEPNNESWALEKTLQTVKGVLDNIQTNTAKVESVEVTPAKVEVGNVLATENTLMAIKVAVEAINKKVVKGTKAKISEDGKKKSGAGKKNAEGYAGSQYFPEKLKTQTMQLAKFRAQLITTGKLTDDVDVQIYELLDALSRIKSGPDFSEWSQKFQQLKTSVGITDIFDKAEGKEASNSYQQLIALQRTRNKLELQYEKAQDDSAVKQFYAEQLAQIDGVIAKQEELLENEEYELKLAKMREEQARKLGEAEAKAADKNAKKQATNAKKLAQREAMLGKAGNAVGRAENTWMSAVGIEGELPAGFVAEIDDYYQKLDALRKKHQELKNSDIISEEQKKDLIAQTMSVNKMTEEIGELVAEYQKLNGDNATVIGTNTLDSDAGLGAYEQQLKQTVIAATNGKAQIKNFDAATKTLTYTVKTGKNEFTEYTAAVRRLDGQLVSVQGTTKRTETFFEATARKMKELTSYFSGMAVFNQISQELRKGIQYVREIDLALTELRKVTDETEETYDKFLDTAAKTGARLGTTISAVTEATATFAKLGYSMEQATEMAESAIVYKNVGDNIESTEDAADSIISTMKGFRLEASESMAIVDRFNEVGNRFAITSRGIGEALRLSASALSEGGNSLDESIGLITAANEVVNDPSSVGTALKTLTLRLRGSKTELEEMGEDVSDMATTTSQLQAKLLALTGGQVDIMLDENTFKNSTQILREMAAAWEDMTDIQRASALELMGGKRQANVLSALIQNFDTVEKVIETSANSAGSALEENERYLDSIQGKIDQFNNAMQAMWSNTLDSDIVKGFVSLGTEIIKIIDEIGLLNSALLAFGAYKGLGAIFGIFKDAGISIEFFTKKLGSYLLGINTVTAAETTLTQAQVARKLTQQGLTAEQAQAIAAQTGLATSTANLSRETLMASLQAQGYSAAEAEAIATKIFGTTVTNASAGALLQETIQRKLQNSALIQYAINMNLARAADVAKMTTTQLLGLSFKALGVAVWSATKAVIAFLFTNPVGWIILAIGAIAGGIAIFNHFHKTTEELTEELNDLKSELQDIQSELESVNSELETTNDRMAELLAKESLSFVEEEELKKLKALNEELERKQRILEIEEKRAKQDVADKAKEVVKSQMFDVKWYDYLIGGIQYAVTGDPFVAANNKTVESKLKNKIDGYQSLIDQRTKLEEELATFDENIDKKIYDEKKKELDKINDKIKKNEQYVDDTLLSLQQALDGVEYGYGADEELDKYYNALYRNEISRGTIGAESDGISHIFSRPEHEAAKTALDEYVEALAKGDPSAKKSIENIIYNNDALVKDIGAMGLELEDAVNYFVRAGKEINYSTIEGKIKEMAEASSRLPKFLSGAFSKDFVGPLTREQEEFANLFDKNGKVLSDAVAEYFGGEGGGISAKTQAEIERLVQQIYDGKISVENALKQFELFGIESTVEIYIPEVKTNFKGVFVELEEADGLIDTFEELGEAIGSTANALKVFNKAEAEMANSGRVSIETALQLMEYTDDYGSVLQVVDGKLQLVDGAEDALIQTRINAIKTSAEAGLADAQLAYDKAKLATQTYKDALATDMSAEVVAKAWEKVLAAGAGLMEGIKSLLTDESWIDAYNRGYNETLSNITGYEIEYTDTGLQALVDAEADAEKAVKAAQDRVNLVDQLTPETLEGINDADDVDTKEDVAKNRFQEAMDYWENRIAANQAKYEQLQSEIDLLEKKGQKADASFYQEQIKLENERKELLERQKKEALARLKEIEAVGGEGNEQWWETAEILNGIEGELDDVAASIVDLQDTIGEIDTYKFEEFNNRLDDITSKLGTIRDLIAPDEEDWFDDEGNWTEDGVAVLGTYIQELETYKQGLAEVEDAYANYVKEYAGNEKYYANLGIHSEQELYDKREELIEQQYDYAQSISDTEQSVVDMYESNVDAIEEYTETLIDSYNDYIDSVKEALDAERDYTL